MGFLDFLTGKSQCPKCGTPGAQKEGNQIRCLNPTCEWFDPGLLQGMGGSPDHEVFTPSGAQEVVTRRDATTTAGGGSSPGRTLTIRYRNFRGEDLTFPAEAESATQRKNHISVRVVPTGQRVTLARARIQNLRELEEVIPPRVAPGQAWPTPRERQILGYHKKHGTTSPLYEKIRAKYPNW